MGVGGWQLGVDRAPSVDARLQRKHPVLRRDWLLQIDRKVPVEDLDQRRTDAVEEPDQADRPFLRFAGREREGARPFELPAELLEVIWFMPGICPNCRSRGAVIDDAMTSGLAPG